ncbi:MAG TPA: glycosyltransferase family 4 protein [Streptosporangiaceae bacterium]|nr:glycosyltransferase family 4 protein [Streptosporangiaceae bacterium]
MTTHSPRALTLAASIGWRHVTADPVRALLLAWRVLPAPLRGCIRLAGPYGRAAVLWGEGDRQAALAALAGSPRRQAVFALAADQPAVAAAALEKLPDTDPSRPVLAARLAWREGRLTDAIRALGHAPGRRARRLRASLAAQRNLLAATPATQTMIMGSSGSISTGNAHDHERGHSGTRDEEAGNVEPGIARRVGPGTAGREPAPGRHHVPGRVLHLVSDALPSVSAGYTIRTHEIVQAQRKAGLEPHVATRAGFPVTQGRIDGRRLVTVEGVPYHRLLPWRLPGHGDADPRLAALGEKLADRLTQEIRPAVLHAASNFANARPALALGRRYGLPVVYEVRGFWEDTWLSRHQDRADGASLARSELYQRSRALETECMLAADLVVTLGEAMREEIEARGVPAGKILLVPNAVSEDFLAPLPDPGKLRAELGIQEGEYVVGEVTSLVRHEGIGTLLEATAILRDRGVPARALIVGDGPERAALQRQAAEAGLAQAAVFTGRVPAAKVRQFHALLDIFVVPRTPDRVCQLVTPLKPIEAMASGLCVVTSEVKALTEIVKHEVTGMQTVPQDPVSLADCLELLIYSPDIRRKLGDNAREWVSGDRTWARNAARYKDAYARLGAI